MRNRKPARPCFQWSAIGLSAAMLLGCGGGGDSSLAQSEQLATVQVSETATILSVKAELPDGAGTSSSEMQSRLYTFAAKVSAGPDAGLELRGTLVLKGDREDDGATEVEGRLLPDVVEAGTPSSASADLKSQFEAKRRELKVALRADVDALSTTLRRALAEGAVPGGDEPSTAQKEALAAFKVSFMQRMTEYHAALSALIADFRASSQPNMGSDDDDDKASEGYEVEGTVDAQGAMNLTVRLGDKGKVLATGTIGADGSVQNGILTGPGSGSVGTWSAMPAGATALPPAPAPAPAPVGPSAANGKVLYNAIPGSTMSCASCHTAVPANNVANVLKGANNASAIAAAIAGNKGGMGILSGKLTAAQLADIAAYLGQPNL